MMDGYGKKKGAGVATIGDYGQMDELNWKLKEAKYTIKELKNDLMGHKKIQAEQGRALNKITYQTENPSKMNSMMTDLRI